jgi:hypothetical protein
LPFGSTFAVFKPSARSPAEKTIPRDWHAGQARWRGRISAHRKRVPQSAARPLMMAVRDNPMPVVTQRRGSSDGSAERKSLLSAGDDRKAA